MANKQAQRARRKKGDRKVIVVFAVALAAVAAMFVLLD